MSTQPGQLLVYNFEEVRRRSIMIWKSLSEEHNQWRPDNEAESLIEIVRHVLECEQLFHQRIINRGPLDSYISPWKDIPIRNLDDELQIAKPYREEFLNMVGSFTAEDLEIIKIEGNKKTQTRKLNDYLCRAAYHEAVHAGQFLAHLRTLGLHRPYVWD